MVYLSEMVSQEYIDCVADILADPDIQSLKQYRQHLTSNRLAHCINVSYLAWWLAKKKGADERMAARAGLLHDFCMYDFHGKDRDYGESEVYRHPKIAARTSREHFHI